MRTAIRVLAMVLLFGGALVSIAALIGLAERRREASWLLMFSLGGIEAGVQLRRIAGPLAMPA